MPHEVRAVVAAAKGEPVRVEAVPVPDPGAPEVGVPTPEMRIDIPMIDVVGPVGALTPSWHGGCRPSRDVPLDTELRRQGRLDLDALAEMAEMEGGKVLRSVVVVVAGS